MALSRSVTGKHASLSIIDPFEVGVFGHVTKIDEMRFEMYLWAVLHQSE